jgi:hypothetical protein
MVPKLVGKQNMFFFVKDFITEVDKSIKRLP